MKSYITILITAIVAICCSCHNNSPVISQETAKQYPYTDTIAFIITSDSTSTPTLVEVYLKRINKDSSIDLNSTPVKIKNTVFRVEYIERGIPIDSEP